jgi:hypothetical protein
MTLLNLILKIKESFQALFNLVHKVTTTTFESFIIMSENYRMRLFLKRFSILIV